MEKTLEILERNVQWFALGLGVIFLAWVAYRYVITPPAQVQLPGGGVAGPGQVATATNNGPVRKFDQENSRKDAPDFATPDIVSSWRGQMNRPFGSAIGVYVFDGLTSGGSLTHEPGAPTNNDIHLAALPVLPEARPLAAAAGLSVVKLPAPPVNPNVRQPVVAVVNQKDLLWDVVAFKIPADALAKAFAAPLNGKPSPGPEIYNTTLLQVVLQRQRATGVDANGQPVFPEGEQGIQEIPPLAIYKAELQPLPEESAPVAKRYEFVDWAQKNPDLIARPPFYEVIAGDPWTPPQDDANAAPGNAAPGNGAPGNDAPGNAAGPDAAGAAQPATAPVAPTNPPASTTEVPKTPAPVGNPFYAPEDRERASAPAYYPPLRAYQAAYEQPGRGSYGRGSYGRGDPRMNSRQRGGYNPPNQFNAPNQFGNGGGVSGIIDPLNLQEDIEIWCHDETVKPGQIYRYRVIYKMKNPVFEIANMADPKLVNTLTLSSKPSKWCDPVKIPETTKFWLARLDEKAYFDVFHWSNGAWKASKKILMPGDLVPGTDWSLVDLRRGAANHAGDRYVLLTDDAGDMSRRTFAIDQADPNRQIMIDQTNPNGGAGSGGNVTPPPLSPGRRPTGRPPIGRGGRAAYGGR